MIIQFKRKNGTRFSYNFARWIRWESLEVTNAPEQKPGLIRIDTSGEHDHVIKVESLAEANAIIELIEEAAVMQARSVKIYVKEPE